MVLVISQFITGNIQQALSAYKSWFSRGIFILLKSTPVLISHYYTPQPSIFRSAIHSIWQLNGHTPFQKEQILPKGIVEIIFNFSGGAPIPVKMNGRTSHLGNCFINGLNKAPINLLLPEKQVFLGVMLRPFAVKKIIGAPAGLFADDTVDLTLIDTSFNSLWHQLAELDDFDARVTVLTNWARAKDIDLAPQEDMLNDFLYAPGQHTLSVSQLAGSVCYSTRQLSRKLLEATGMNAEELLVYKKYLHALGLIHTSHMTLTEIAYESNFSDQSHFIRAFKSFTSIKPGEYRQKKSYVKGHMYEDVR